MSTPAAPAMSVCSASPTASTRSTGRSEALQHRLIDRRIRLADRAHVAAEFLIAHRQRAGAQHAHAAADHLQVGVGADHRQAVAGAVLQHRPRTRPSRWDCDDRPARCSARNWRPPGPPPWSAPGPRSRRGRAPGRGGTRAGRVPPTTDRADAARRGAPPRRWSGCRCRDRPGCPSGASSPAPRRSAAARWTAAACACRPRAAGRGNRRHAGRRSRRHG